MTNAQTPAANPEGSPKKKYPVNLPSTPFAMKANLVQNEPASLKRWGKIGLYAKVRAARAGSPKFVFHDGPPYANGSIHLGHLMNKVLKDFVVRSKSMQGLDCPYVPGWDCHGLPIEHKVMTELVESGKVAKLNTLDEWTRKKAVRGECQKYAEKFHKLHTQQMTRLLTLADYQNPYLTMRPDFEFGTLEVLATLLDRGLVYRALKPVHWSVANETALAEAELEYQDREDTSVYVDFEAADADAVYDAFGLTGEADDDETEDEAEPGDDTAKGVKPGVRPHSRPTFMIWTTTPWTLPANLAIAVNPGFEYALVYLDGNFSVVAASAVERVAKLANVESVVVIATTTGDKLVGLKYRHPFIDLARGESAAAIPNASTAAVFSIAGADYVTLEDGTGLVHTAPGHGTEDYQTGLRIGLPIYCPVKADGTYDTTVPAWLREPINGKAPTIWDANAVVVKKLRDSGHLFFDQKFMHSYPHDWRSKTPVIFRCTDQWFISVEKDFTADDASTGSLRERGLASATGSDDKRIQFVPAWGQNRLRGMLDSRPDWCISRQRAWGLPIPAFVYTDAKGDEKSFMTAASARIVAALVKEKGSDIWFSAGPAELLAGYTPSADADCPPEVAALFAAGNAATLRKGPDILDVWFESGSSWNAVMRQRGLGYPTDLYLEGSDQHRGWFQVSLLTALGTTGRPPFRTLLTHGFIVDRDGKKLSKSRPDAARYEVDNLCGEFGMDVMRWWVSSLAYEDDIKADLELFATSGESYRKVRNTIRFMLSNLADFSPTCDGKAGHCVDLASFPPTSIDAWVLAEFDRLHATVLKAYNDFDFRTAYLALFNFCNTTLSSIYLAAVKDRLYCDRIDSPRRRRTQTTLWDLTEGLCRLLAPILCHTADEAHRALWKATADDDRCVHTLAFASTNAKADPRWAKVMDLREKALASMEKARAALGVENPLDMGIALPSASIEGFDLVDLADLLGVSEVTSDASATEPRVIDLRERPKCERSWKRDGTVKLRKDGGILSDRDAEAVLGSST